MDIKALFKIGIWNNDWKPFYYLKEDDKFLMMPKFQNKYHDMMMVYTSKQLAETNQALCKVVGKKGIEL